LFCEARNPSFFRDRSDPKDVRDDDDEDDENGRDDDGSFSRFMTE